MELSPEFIKRIKRGVRTFCYRCGIKRDIEDITQEVCLHYLRKERIGSTIDQVTIDVLRSFYGRTNGEPRLGSNIVRRRLATASQFSANKHTKQDVNGKFRCTDADILEIIDRVCEENPRAGLAIQLMYSYGLLLHEVAQIFGVSESLVSQTTKPFWSKIYREVFDCEISHEETRSKNRSLATTDKHQTPQSGVSHVRDASA